MGRDGARVRIPIATAGGGLLRIQIRWALLLALGGVPLIGLLLGDLWAVSATRTVLEDQYRTELTRELGMGTNLLRLSPDATPDSLAAILTGTVGFRTTIIAPDGRVLGDSDVTDAELGSLENHGARPEVKGALAEPGEVSFHIRTSTTLGVPLLYGARLVSHAGATRILRMAIPVDAIDSMVWQVRRMVWLAWLGVFLLALLAWYGLSRRLTPYLKGLSQSARRLADGDLTVRFETDSGVEELDRAAASLNRLADEVNDRVGELARETVEVETLLDSIDEGILALTDDARVLRTNTAARELLGIGEPPPFSPIGALIRQPDLRELLESVVVAPVEATEVQVGDRSLLLTSRLLDRGGSVVTFRDVTAVRRLEQIRSDFVANASHELKTPLTTMRGFAETLLEADPPEDLRINFLGFIRDNSIRLQRLVDDLLDLSRLESGGWQASEDEVEIGDLAHEVWTESFSRKADQLGVGFAVKGSALVLADEGALEQVFRNLFDNAIRYSSRGGRLRVSIGTDGPMVRITVEDSGSGIPSAVLPRIFERFFRADPARSRAEGGTGLGLAIVRHLVQAMGGEVGAESELGKGTRVTFTLPSIGAAEA